eukprot:1052793-Pleurochrysis_carterae.AAC.1
MHPQLRRGASRLPSDPRCPPAPSLRVLLPTTKRQEGGWWVGENSSLARLLGGDAIKLARVRSYEVTFP